MTWPAQSRRRAELPADWPKIRTRILHRDGGRCTWTEQGLRCPADATDVDHIRDPHDHRDSNLRSLCRPHHDQATQRQAQRARGAGPDRYRPAPPHPGRVGDDPPQPPTAPPDA